MARNLALTVSFFLALAATGCDGIPKQPPEEVYSTPEALFGLMQEYARDCEWDGFYEYVLAKETRGLLTRTEFTYWMRTQLKFHRLLRLGDYAETKESEKGFAFAIVRFQDVTFNFPLVKENGRWKALYSIDYHEDYIKPGLDQLP